MGRGGGQHQGPCGSEGREAVNADGRNRSRRSGVRFRSADSASRLNRGFVDPPTAPILHPADGDQANQCERTRLRHRRWRVCQ